MSPDNNGVLGYFTRHGTTASFILVLMLALGLVATSKIRSQFFPDVVVDTITVTIGWDGAGPEDLDRAVVALLEPALQGVEGVINSTAVSKDSATTLTLTLSPGWDMARATEDVKAAVEGVRSLPDNTEEPVVRRSVWRDKVTEVVISGPIAPDQLAQIGDDFVAQLYRVGITRTQITGVAAPQIDIAVPEAARVRHEIALKDVANAIAREVDTRPAGDIAGGGARLRAGSETRDADAIRNLVVRENPDGSKLYVRNLATVSVSGTDAGRAYYMGNDPAVLIRVDRTSEGDAIDMEATVRRLATEVEPELPAGVKIQLINARAQDITDRLDILLSNGLSGLALVLVVLFLFLSARTAFWVAMGIPVSMLAAVGVMYAMGLTINMMSLFALIITLGIVVDDAIVVAEHSDHRRRRLGESPNIAPVNAARKMLGPVFGSTVTTVLAFIALLFIGGQFGRLIADIPYVVTAVLIASLVESFLILPNHMRHALLAGAKKRWYDWPSTQLNHGFAWVVSVTGALSEDNAARAAEIGAQLRDEILPSIAAKYNIAWDLGGLALQQNDFLVEAMIGFMLCIIGIYLVLGWVFGSWFRPLIVLAVIPFGLIGTVWGHGQFGLAMSLFTIIGLIGMSGIIVNDAIVLVTTVQDYAKRLPIAHAAVAGARDRLRPILLTTLTTVLGLAPLMYEESRQSLFLKPTVVTLVYGLTVGFFIVLLMVPALMVIQTDIANAMRSLRRMAGGTRVPNGLRAGTVLAGLAILAANLGLMVPWIRSGEVAPPLQSIFGDLPSGALLVLAATLVSLAIAVVYVVGVKVSGRRDGARRQPESRSDRASRMAD